MKVRVIKKNIFRDGKLHRVGSEMTLNSEKEFSKNYMEWIDKPKRGKKKKVEEKPVEQETVVQEEVAEAPAEAPVAPLL